MKLGVDDVVELDQGRYRVTHIEQSQTGYGGTQTLTLKLAKIIHTTPIGCAVHCARS